MPNHIIKCCHIQPSRLEVSRSAHLERRMQYFPTKEKKEKEKER